MEVGTLLVFNPFSDAVDSTRVVQKVEISYLDSKSKAQTADLTAQATYVDDSKKMLSIDLTNAADTKKAHYKFSEITKITITYPDA
mmetsp:Transcript_29346/g.44223  ORF Transcript_29346/g.44223 Transcript_29346/m.44223 type:complete len:86 (+) Transcript_29346:5598-5855(+)